MELNHDENIVLLDRIENLINLIKLKYLYCCNNKLESLNGVENLINLQELYCYDNNLTSLNGIEKLINLNI